MNWTKPIETEQNWFGWGFCETWCSAGPHLIIIWYWLSSVKATFKHEKVPKKQISIQNAQKWSKYDQIYSDKTN